jgi:hypothetical protein
MVKNTKGGKGAKSMARKSIDTGASASTFPIPTSDMEHFAVVNKMFGPACEVLLLDGTVLFCHIRNKFKGRRKSGNFISIGSILLIGFREWEPDNARKNCDLLFVYDLLQTSSLAERFSLPSLNNNHNYNNHTSHQPILFDYNFNSIESNHEHEHEHSTLSHFYTSSDLDFDLL